MRRPRRSTVFPYTALFGSSAGGSYTVTVTDANGCSATSAATVVTVNPPPVATIAPSGPVAFCAGGNVTLTASAGASYLWSPGNATSARIGSAAGRESAEIAADADALNENSAATVVTVNPPPV